jgi:tetratricopeptide (TPR) repeat protein
MPPIILCAEKSAFEKARQCMDLLNYKKAVFYFGEALKEKPPREEIRTYQGYSYFKSGKINEAVDVLNKEIKLSPENLNAYILLGYIYYEHGNLNKAESVCLDFENRLTRSILGENTKSRLSEKDLEDFYKRWGNKNKNLGIPFFVLGLCRKNSENFLEAGDYFRKASRLGYDGVECSVQLIDNELSQKAWERALQESRKAIRTLGSKSEFYFLMGYSFYYSGDFKNAEYCFNSALELKPYLFEGYKNLAKLYLELKEFRISSEIFKRYLKLFPYDQNIKFLLQRAEKRHQMIEEKNRPELTKELAENVKLQYFYDFDIDINSAVKIINDSAITLLKLGRIKDSINLLSRFLELNDLSPDLNYNLAHFYNMNNNISKSLKFAWRASELKSEFKDALDLIGNIFFKIEDYDNAIRFYTKTLSLDAKDPMTHYNLGCVYSAKGALSEAEKSWLNALRYEKRRNNKPEDQIKDELSISLTIVGRRVAFKSHSALGHLYLKQNLKEKALQQFIKSVQLEPGSSDLYYEIGKIFLDRDDTQNAVKYFEKYLYTGGKKEAEVKNYLKKLRSKHRK